MGVTWPITLSVIGTIWKAIKPEVTSFFAQKRQPVRPCLFQRTSLYYSGH